MSAKINVLKVFKVIEIRLKSPSLVKLLKVFYTGTSAAIKDSKHFLKLLRDVDREVPSLQLFLMFIMDSVLRCA